MMEPSEVNFTLESVDYDPYHKNFLENTRFCVQRILVPTLMIIGIVGNVITIVIMTRRRMRSSTNNYLAALATFDMMYLIFTFVLSLQHYPGIPEVEHYAYWKMRPFIIMLTDTSSNTSVWLTVTFTVERYIAVCHPMKGKVLCTEARAKKAIVAVFFFCFAITIPTPFEWKVIENVDPETNHTTLMLTFSEMGNNALYKTVYYWLTVVLFTFIPLLLLGVFNSFLIRSVHLSKVQRSSMTREREDSSQENKITIMLIAVVILFFFCQLPTASLLVYGSFHEPATIAEENVLRGLGNIFNFLMSLNSAGNFVLYCLLSQKYRRTFVQIFCPCYRQNKSVSSMYYQSTVCTNVDNDSPCSSTGRRSSNARRSPTKGSNVDIADTAKKAPTKTVFLQVPNSTKVVYDDGDVDSMQGNANSKNIFGSCSRMARGPWRRFKRTMGLSKKETREQVIPLKGGGNKCIVITTPGGLSPTSEWAPNSAV